MALGLALPLCATTVSETRARWQHRGRPGMNGVDDLAVVILQIDRRNPEVRVAELPLDHVERHAFSGHLQQRARAEVDAARSDDARRLGPRAGEGFREHPRPTMGDPASDRLPRKAMLRRATLRRRAPVRGRPLRPRPRECCFSYVATARGDGATAAGRTPAYRVTVPVKVSLPSRKFASSTPVIRPPPLSPSKLPRPFDDLPIAALFHVRWCRGEGDRQGATGAPEYPSYQVGGSLASSSRRIAPRRRRLSRRWWPRKEPRPSSRPSRWGERGAS